MTRSQHHLSQVHVCDNFRRKKDDDTFEYCGECGQKWFLNRRRPPFHIKFDKNKTSDIK